MTDNMTPRAVLWDMDGTLLDSHRLHWLAWEEAGRTFGFPITLADFNETFGQRNDTILRRIFGADVSAAELTRISDGKEEIYRGLVQAHGAALLPGVRHWLESLAAVGWRQAIASSAPPANVDALLDVLHIRPFFQAIVHAGDVTRGKPDPEVYLLAAARLGVAPAASVVIEDAPAGIEGARRAGMRCIAVGPLHATLPADISVHSLAELPPDTVARLVDS